MARGRKNGCPVNLKDWTVRILETTSRKYLRIYGLTKLNRAVDGDTEDGSAETDDWAEPFVNKRSGSIKLEGRQVVEPLTGERDPGQAELISYADLVGCDADATLELVDPYGHAVRIDAIVTSYEEDVDDSGQTCSWDLEQVGEAETLPYVHVTGVSLKEGDQDITTLSMAVGDAAKLISIVFAPEGASNRRYKVKASRRGIVSISNITEDGFSLTPISAGTVTVAVTSVNNGKRAEITVTVA